MCRVDVGSGCDLLIHITLLGRLIERRTPYDGGETAMLEQILGDAQITQENALIGLHERRMPLRNLCHLLDPLRPTPARKRKQYVCGLDVAMHDTGLV